MVGINGTGLTSRSILKLVATLEEFEGIEICQINGRSMPLKMLKDRLSYSTSQGHSKLKLNINEETSELIVNDKKIKYTQIANPEDIIWDERIEIILESTGVFRDKSNEKKNPYRHFDSTNKNLKAVVITAPGKGGICDYMFMGTPNLEEKLKSIIERGKPFVIGAASCTTTATVPIIDTLDINFGVESCFLTTVHATTRSQDILDGSKGWSAYDTLLHTTGATLATNKVIEKEIPMFGIAYRTSDKAGSFIQIDAVLKTDVTKDDLLQAFKESKYAPYISYSDVKCPPSSYIRGNTNMVMLIPEEFVVVNKNRVIIKGLYDNEEGYAAHFLRLINTLDKLMKK